MLPPLLLDESEERLEVLKARINLANEELKLKRSQLENDTRLAEAMVDKAQANLDEEEIQPEANLFDRLESLFREYSRAGTGLCREYISDEV